MNTNTELYERDFFEWTHTTAELIRDGVWWQIDADALAEEIESLGKSQQHALESGIHELVLHLLKWCYQPEGHQYHGSSWEISINKQRVALELLIRDFPSFKPRLQTVLDTRYPKARKHASTETRLPLTTFPPVSPWTLEQILDDDFWPDVTS